MTSTDSSHSAKRPGGWRILIAGTGGQGVLTAARLLCDFFTTAGHEVVSGQLHGMAQRGGSVQSTVMIGCGIGPAMPEGCADVVLGFEPVETVRALCYLSDSTKVYMNTTPVIPFTLAQSAIRPSHDGQYPDIEKLIAAVRAVTPHLFAFDATGRARQAGSAASLNMAMLGCALGSRGLPCTASEFWKAVAPRLPARSAETNVRAFEAGVEAGRAFHVGEARPCN